MLDYKNSFRLLSLVFFFSLSACVAGDGDDDNDDSGDSGKLDLEISATTNDNGSATINFRTANDVSKFSVIAESGSNRSVRINRLTVGGKDYLNPGGESVSFADTFSPVLATANVPSRDFDESLSSPQDVTVSASVEGSQTGNNSVLFKVTSRTDGNTRSGKVRMNVFYVGSVASQESTKEAIRSGLNIARDIFSNSAGISLTITEADVSGPVNIPIPTEGSSLYLNSSSAAASPAVNVFFGGDIASVSGEVLGISASIPGPPTPSSKSAVAISIFTSAGADGFFDSEDIRILGETIAHESGHFMGLFHPIDFNGSVVSNTDPLTDTAGCSFVTDCVTNPDLTSNLMFPSPVQDGNGGFVPQNKLTSQQRGVINLYSAVD